MLGFLVKPSRFYSKTDLNFPGFLQDASVAWWLAIGNAQRLGIENVICFSGNRNGPDDATGLKVTAEA